MNFNLRHPPDAHRMQASLFWFVVVLMVGIKLVLVSDLSVMISYSPHDDSLYVERAFAFLSSHGFGPYDSKVLVKYPGISLWLAGGRLLGLPFLLSVHLTYLVAGLYMLGAFLRCGTHRGIALLAFGFFLFNPITFGVEWTRVLREPLSMGIFTALTASMLYITAGIASGKRIWLHLMIFSLAFAFSLYLREDDRLLWGLLALFVAVLTWQARQRVGGWSGIEALPLIVVLFVPVGTALAYEAVLRDFVERNYGMPILHEYSEGEYPRFMAAIRSIDSAKDNRLVMVSQEKLQKLRGVVPRLAPLIDSLPPPGPSTHSCKWHGICSEWANGWIAFWIRDAAYQAGLTPSLTAAQAYFREARFDIERACQDGRLKCTSRGSALVPPMELRWARAYVAEAWRLAGIAISPDPNVIGTPQLFYDVHVELGRKFQAVTMTDRFDTQFQTSFANRAAAPVFSSPLAEYRVRIVKPYQVGACALLLAAFLFFAWKLWTIERRPLSPVAAVVIVVGLYILGRFLILSYVAVFMGAFDSRMMFSTYTVATFLALPFIYDSFRKEQGINA